MNEHDALIFDLDGTLTDPSLGIGRSLNYALAAFAVSPVDAQTIAESIGPPLDLVFGRIVPAATEETILGLVAKYRERYGNVGYAENVVYAGVPEALDYLASRGVPMGVCTSKRADFAEQILALFKLREYFRFVSGGDVGVRKDGQLSALLAQGAAGSRAMMIGDRAVDVMAAKANSLRSAGVLWGHGSLEELRRVAPDRLLEVPGELKGLIDGDLGPLVYDAWRAR